MTNLPINPRPFPIANLQSPIGKWQMASGIAAAALFAVPSLLLAQERVPQALPLGHDRTRPLPPVVQPGTPGNVHAPGTAPSDAVVLFDGTDLSAWVAMDGKPTRWIVREGAMECVPGSGYIRTRQSFGACQLHLEFATPAKAEGQSQGRGNSGVFFGRTRYEVQVLDSFENPTYADGSCGAIYNQYPPLVNASRPPGEWQSYDILWTPPRFSPSGELLSPPRITAFHNGVLIHHNAELFGQTDWLARPPLQPHPEKLPLSLQDHGNPVQYRNVWVRELGPTSRAEFMLAEATLDAYCGTYENDDRHVATFRRHDDGTLLLDFRNHTFVMFASSENRFFAKTIDIQAEFSTDADGVSVQISVGETGGARAAKVR